MTTKHRLRHLKQVLLLCSTIFLANLSGNSQLLAQPADRGHPKSNSVVIELFYRSDSDQSQNAQQFLEQLVQRRPGIEAKAYDVLKDRQQLKRLWQLSKQFGHEQAKVPTFFLCNRLQIGFPDPQASGAQIENLLNIKAYIRPGCKHCQAGKQFLDDLVLRRPALRVQYFDVVADFNARQEAQNVAARYRVQVPSFPVIEVAGRLVVGFQTTEITGRNIEDLFQDRSVDLGRSDRPESDNPSDSPDSGGKQNADRSATGGSSLTHWFWGRRTPNLLATMIVPAVDTRPVQQQQDEAPPLPDEFQLPDDAPLPEDVPLPDDDSSAIEMLAPDQDVILSGGQSDEIEVPLLGQLSVSSLGMPAFTFLIGLVDGFNPCAMWVLIFLLSVLVNIKERKKILLVAGTFVIVSGLAYFVFMAAWFNVFQLIGLLRPVQIGLGIVALIVGLINVKDFFAFHQGVTLSIPESAKPGIYRRVRQIVSANHMITALVGAIILAVVVNIVELLCTAGLPAMYTQILTMQNLPAWANYSYLALYIAAYMLDDTILVGVVLITLSNRRLQESEGRWLKLLSGTVILLLGVVMIFWPELLV